MKQNTFKPMAAKRKCYFLTPEGCRQPESRDNWGFLCHQWKCKAFVPGKYTRTERVPKEDICAGAHGRPDLLSRGYEIEISVLPIGF